MVSPWQSQDVREEILLKGPVTMTPRIVAQTTIGRSPMFSQGKLVKITWNKSSAWRPVLEAQNTTSRLGPKEDTASTRNTIVLTVGKLFFFGSGINPFSTDDSHRKSFGFFYQFIPAHEKFGQWRNNTMLLVVIVFPTWYQLRKLNRSVLSHPLWVLSVTYHLSTWPTCKK